MKARQIGNKAAHISWAVFVSMLVLKWMYPGLAWWVVFAPFLIPFGVIAVGIGVVTILLGLAHVLAFISDALKRINRDA